MPHTGTPIAMEGRQQPILKTAVGYAVLLGLAAGVFLLIRSYGMTLVAPAAAPGAAIPAAGNSSDTLYHVLLALAAVVAAGRLTAAAFKSIGQPPVIGEVIAGIALGPSLLGMLDPVAYRYILPPDVAPYLGILSQLGVIFYMFLVGLELNPAQLRGRGHSPVAISHASIVVPFTLGAALALYIYPRFSTADVEFTSFALFMGLSMSVTAFPVLARILSDTGLSATKLGTLALTCAAIDDVTAWCLLAFVVGIVDATADRALLVTFMTIAFIVLMWVVVRPFLVRRTARLSEGPPSQALTAVVLLGLLLSTLTTEWIGVHAIFGAFLYGAVFPHDSELAQRLRNGLNLATILLLPAFFAFTGMRTSIALVSGAYEWLICGLIIAVATAGKFGGTFMASRWTGLDWRESAALGTLMNTRGLMELIVLNVGLELGVISQKVFTMLVLMAVVTTIATTPLLRRLILRP